MVVFSFDVFNLSKLDPCVVYFNDDDFNESFCFEGKDSYNDVSSSITPMIVAFILGTS